MLRTQTPASAWARCPFSVPHIVVVLVLFEHGTQKLSDVPPRASGMGPGTFSLLSFAVVIEIGDALLLGLFTRSLAFVLSGQMASGDGISPALRNTLPALNGGDAPVPYCFMFLCRAVAGGGIWSRDRAWKPSVTGVGWKTVYA
jgi:putative oxidoreductase